jgi:hypothetical protein
VAVVSPNGGADQPGAGVTVVVTDGATTITTLAQTSALHSPHPAGFWKVTGLPVPGDYTATFSRFDLASQTVAVSLDAFGNVTTGAGSTLGSSGLSVRLDLATATLAGTVTQANGRVCNAAHGLGEAQVTLNSGLTTYRVTTATVPKGKCGQYLIAGVLPGSYTLTVDAGSGTIASSLSVQLTAGELLTKNVSLRQPASITGSLVDNSHNPLCGWTIFLYKASEYPDTVTAHVQTTSGANNACSAGFGKFTFPIVDAGTYIIAASPTPDPVNAQATKTISVKPSEQYGTSGDGTVFSIRVPI